MSIYPKSRTTTRVQVYSTEKRQTNIAQNAQPDLPLLDDQKSVGRNRRYCKGRGVGRRDIERTRESESVRQCDRERVRGCVANCPEVPTRRCRGCCRERDRIEPRIGDVEELSVVG